MTAGSGKMGTGTSCESLASHEHHGPASVNQGVAVISRTSEREGKGDCVKEGGGEEGERGRSVPCLFTTDSESDTP